MIRLAFLVFIFSFAAFAQWYEPPRYPEEFRVEVTASGWHTGVNGTLQSGVLPVDLRSDLALQDRWTFSGRLVWKPVADGRHRILVEGAPFDFDGRNALARQITYQGRTFDVRQTIASEARLTYVYAGYQFDAIRRDWGHLGFNAGGAYLNAEGTISGIEAGLTANRERHFGIPLVGAEFRVAPIPRFRQVSVSGGAKGMPLGGYGYFTQGEIKGGYTVGPVTFQAGWAVLDADIHENRSLNPAGVAPRISGPVIGIVAAWR